jgi:hypothetical protein
VSTCSIPISVALTALACIPAGCSGGESPAVTDAGAQAEAQATPEAEPISESEPPAPTVQPSDEDAEPVAEQHPGFPEQPGWIRQELDNKMRLAQFRLPREAGDAEDAALVVFSFGGAAGDVDSNIARWTQMFEQEDGSEASTAAEPRERDGMTFHTVDISGHFVAPAMPGGVDAADKPGWRLIGTVVEAGAKTYYVKLTGPNATVERWRASYAAFLDQLDPPR